MKRWAIAIAIILGLAVIGGAGYLGYQSSQPAVSDAPVAPLTIGASQGDVQRTVTAPGQLVGTQQVMLGMDVDGRLVELNVRPGTVVSAGDIIARIDPTRYENALEIAQIELGQAQNSLDQQLANAELTTVNSEALIGATQAQYPLLTAAEVNLQLAREAEQRAWVEYDKAINRHWDPPEVHEAYRLEWAHSQANTKVAEAEYNSVLNQRWAVGQQVEAQQTELERAQSNLTFLQDAGVNPLLETAVAHAEAELAATVLVAPFDGVVLDVFVTNGESVGSGMNLVRLADPAVGEVRTTVIEEDLADVKIGQPAELFFDARPDIAVQGKVARLVPQRVVGEARPLYHVYVTLEDHLPDGVFPGMTVDASIIVAERFNTVRLPRTLVRARSDGTATVELWQNGRRVEQGIVLGLRGDVFVAVESGLDADDQVVGE